MKLAWGIMETHCPPGKLKKCEGYALPLVEKTGTLMVRL